MEYQLWDWESGNAIGEYESEVAALRVIHKTVQSHGRKAVATFGLVRVNTRGRSKLIAEGDELANRAERVASHGEPDKAPPVQVAV